MYLPEVFGRDVFDDFFSFPFFKGEKACPMKTDVRRTENSYEVETDLPGFDKDEIKVALDNGYLTISAEKDDSSDNSEYIRRERYRGVCSRRFYVGEDITDDEIKARFDRGILKLTIPIKPETSKVEGKKYIAIE